jgi:hypothetical protein
VTRPSTTDDGLYAAGLRFGEQRVMAILAALVAFCYLIKGFTNRQLVERVGGLLDSSSSYSCRQATYDLRRLKRKGHIAKVARSRRYQLTGLGRRVAVLFTKAYGSSWTVLLPPMKPIRLPAGSKLIHSRMRTVAHRPRRPDRCRRTAHMSIRRRNEAN